MSVVLSEMHIHGTVGPTRLQSIIVGIEECRIFLVQGLTALVSTEVLNSSQAAYVPLIRPKSSSGAGSGC